MKSIKEILESKKLSFYAEVQNEIDANAGYHTLDISDGKNKYKMGFISMFEDEDCISIQGCNSGKDFAELLGTEEDAYDFLDKMKIGETRKNITRIW